MHKIRYWIPFLVFPFAFGTFSSLTATEAQAAAIEQFRNFMVQTTTGKGEFKQVQVKQEDKTKISNAATGTFSFARPGKFVWKYQKPYEQIIQADGSKLYIYDKDLNQVTIKKLGEALGNSPAAILFGNNRLENHFTLRELGSRDGIEWVEALPKQKDTAFNRVHIGMRHGLPVTIELYDAFNQVTLIHFTQFDKNPALKPGTFSFNIPKGADVFQP